MTCVWNFIGDLEDLGVEERGKYSKTLFFPRNIIWWCGLCLSHENMTTNEPSGYTTSKNSWRAKPLQAPSKRFHAWCQTSTAKYMITALFWVITQRVVFSFLLTFRDNLSLPPPGGRSPEDGPKRLSRNVDKKLLLLAAWQRRSGRLSSSVPLQRLTEIPTVGTTQKNMTTISAYEYVNSVLSGVTHIPVTASILRVLFLL